MNISRWRKPAAASLALALVASIAGAGIAAGTTSQISTRSIGALAAAGPNVSSEPIMKFDYRGDAVGADAQDPQKPGNLNLVAMGGYHLQVTNPGSTQAQDSKHLTIGNHVTGQVVQRFTFDNTVRAPKFCNSNTELYVGGDFTVVNGTAIKWLVKFKWNGSSFVIDTTFKPRVPPQRLRTLECGTDGLFFGGDTQGTFKVRYDTGAAISTFGANITTDGNVGFVSSGPRLVRSLLLSPDGQWLYIGGHHTTLDGVSSPGVGRVNATTGQVDANFDAINIVPAGPDGKGGENIVSMAWDVVNNRLLVGGAGEARNSLRALNPVTGAQVWGEDNMYGDTQSIVVKVLSNGKVWIIIGFHWNKSKNPEVANKPGVCDNFAIFDGATGLIIGLPDSTGKVQCRLFWDPRFEGSVTYISAALPGNPSQGNGGVQKILLVGETILFFGQFRTVNKISQPGIAKFTLPAPPAGSDPDPTPTPTPTENPTETPSPTPTSTPCVTTPAAA